MAIDGAMLKTRDSLAAGLDKYVKQAGRNTIALNAENDTACAGYARVPGPDACDFCVTMGAANDFYHSEATAGGGASHGTADDAYHPYCNCQIAVIFKKGGKLVARDPETGVPVDYNGKELLERYDKIGRPTYSNVSGAGGGSGKPAALPQKEFNAAMKQLASAETVDELHNAGKQIVANWAAGKAGRNVVQWRRMSKFAKEREKALSMKEAGVSSAGGSGGLRPPIKPPTGGSGLPDKFRTGREIHVDGVFGVEKSTWEVMYDGEMVKLFIPESLVTDEVVFAGYCTSTEFKNAELLASVYGGVPEKWFHSRGSAWLFDPLDGRIRRAEIHWCEEETAGIHEIAFKNWLT